MKCVWYKLAVAVLAAMFCCTHAVAHDTKMPTKAKQLKLPKLENHKPLVDFTSWTEQDGKFKDKTGNVTLTPGENMKIVNGPSGGKAMLFDGTKKGVGRLDFGKFGKNIDGFDYALSFWFRCDEIQNTKLDSRLAGNSPVPGMDVRSMDSGHFDIRAHGGPGISGGGDLNAGRWNHVAVIYSKEKRIRLIYFNGFPVTSTAGVGIYFPLRQKYNVINIGSFKGALADLKIWDKAIPPDQFLNIEILPNMEKELRDTLTEQLKRGGNSPGARMMVDGLTKELDQAIAAKKIPLEQYNTFLRRIRLLEQLAPGTKLLAKTPLKNTPLALIQVKAVSPEIRTPLTFPSDPRFTSNLRTEAAKGEFVSVSYVFFPYRDVSQVAFEFGDLTGPGGAVIPKKQMELKHVQCWYQPWWNSYFNGHGHYVPSLLLNDPDMIRVDERTKINYLKFYYPSGIEYHNICEPGSVLKYRAFDWAFEPVWDTDELLPVDCKFGRNRQMWLTLQVPKDAKAGQYKGNIKITENGNEIGTATLSLNVLPFTLPMPRTQFDLKKPFFAHLSSKMQIIELTERLKDPQLAEKMTWNNIYHQWKHSLFTQPFTIDPNNPDAFIKTVNMQKKLDLEILAINGGAALSGTLRTSAFEKKPLEEVATVEAVQKELDELTERINKIAPLIDKHVGRRDVVYFYGVDEAQSAGTLRSMMPFRDIVYRNGMQSMSTGWENNFRNDPSHETYHTTAAYVSRHNADRWHAIGAMITCYCGPFIGPDNPHLMRRTHGLNMYRNNYDGWWELAYEGGRYHAWNHRFGYDTTYRPFRVLTPTIKGPLIYTIAFRGIQRGQDDIRYATLMYQLAEECFASKKPENIVAARKAIAWFRNLPMPSPEDLDGTRVGLTHHILTMRKLLGKSTD